MKPPKTPRQIMDEMTEASRYAMPTPKVGQQHVAEVEVHRFACDASDLYGVCPAFQTGWPAQFPTSLGNGLDFIAVAKKLNADGDVEYVRYEQANGCIELKVFND